MPTIVFEPVSLRGQKTGKCPGCGKRRLRAKTFQQTLNPFNVNDKGLPKNRHEIIQELQAEIRQWKAQPVECC